MWILTLSEFIVYLGCLFGICYFVCMGNGHIRHDYAHIYSLFMVGNSISSSETRNYISTSSFITLLTHLEFKIKIMKNKILT